MILSLRLFPALCLVLSLVAPAVADTSDMARPGVETGYASYYAESRNNMRTATGERENPLALTAAHWTLPLGSWVRVTNLVNGKSVQVRINDRKAPSVERIIDLSRAAAKQLGMMAAGLARVAVEPISPPSKRRAGKVKP